MSKPCSQLNSKLIRDTAECHIVGPIQGLCSVLSFKCIWRVERDNVASAWLWVCEKRDECDAKLASLSNVPFFLSSISTSKLQLDSKKSKTGIPSQADDESTDETCVAASQVSTPGKQIYPAISYWVACQTINGSPVNPLQIQAALGSCGVEVYMAKTSKRRSAAGYAHLDQLCQVLKDHKNPCMMELVDKSYHHSLSTLQLDMGMEEEHISVTENVVRLRVVTKTMMPMLQRACSELRRSGLRLDSFGIDESSQPSTSISLPPNAKPLSGPVTVLVNDIQRAMNKLQYAVYEGAVFKMEDGASFTYNRMCSMNSFLHGLMANERFKDRLVKHFPRVLNILSDPESRIIPQMRIDQDLVEVGGNWFWSFAANAFVTGIIPTSQKGQTSPRAFVPYEPTKEPEPKYFREILVNSLTQEQIHDFCRDFLDLFKPKSHKQRVPCAVGASDSGKTSLFAPVFQIVPLDKIARVTKQKGFNKSMIDETTQVIFLDEANSSLLDVDDWKILCQGGYTAHDSKWKSASGFMSTASMYITCQEEMDFGPEHNPAMDKRLNKYHFKSLHVVNRDAHKWLTENAMECIVWASKNAAIQQAAANTSTNRKGTHGLTEEEIQKISSVSLDDAVDATLMGRSESETDVEADSSSDEDDDEDEDGEDSFHIVQLRAKLALSADFSLKKRQLQILLDRARARKAKEQRDNAIRLEQSIEERRCRLIEMGVIGEEDKDLIQDLDTPLPDHFKKKMQAILEARQQERERMERVKTKRVFANHWLIKTEKELQDYNRQRWETTDKSQKAMFASLIEVKMNKLKLYHEKNGTTNQIAVEQRRKTCIELGLLDANMALQVTSVSTCLPPQDKDIPVSTPPRQQTVFGTPKTPSILETPPASNQQTTPVGGLGADEDHYIPPTPCYNQISSQAKLFASSPLVRVTPIHSTPSRSQQQSRPKRCNDSRKVTNFFRPIPRK